MIAAKIQTIAEQLNLVNNELQVRVFLQSTRSAAKAMRGMHWLPLR